MKNLICCLIIPIVFCLPASAQDIVKLIFRNKNGITEEVKDAKTITAVKVYPKNKFEKLEYKAGGPMKQLITYNDSALTVLHGTVLNYFPDGTLQMKGAYANNLKENEWTYFSAKGNVLYTEKYSGGILVTTEKPEKAKKNAKDESVEADEKEATMVGGMIAWKEFLLRTMNPDVAQDTRYGGDVLVSFVVNTAGETEDIFIKQSAQLLLDEEALRVIRKSPKWIPAMKAGKPVKAYRIQPLSFRVS